MLRTVCKPFWVVCVVFTADVYSSVVCFSFSLYLFVLTLVNQGMLIIGERRRDHEREKYGGVARYGCFSLGDRACCHGAGLAIGGSVGQ